MHTYHKRKILMVFTGAVLLLLLLAVRLGWLMVGKSDYYAKKAKDLHERERSIKAERGEIWDRNGTVIAANRTVCTVSVIHSQITDPETVIRVLTEELEMKEEAVRTRVEKRSSIERIRTNVPKEIGDRIRQQELAGVKVDEDYRRYYPYGELASTVIGFTGGDNQGIVGLEVTYDKILQGTSGKILTMTDARGVELPDAGEERLEPTAGCTLQTSLDMNIQMYATQAALQVLEKKQADGVSILIMRPENGEILAMVNVPEYDLNDPFTLPFRTEGMSSQELQDARNQMWRNDCINDTYEPGSTFKIITASAGLEEGVVSLKDTFFCPGYKIVDDRRIRCHKVGGHGTENFVQAAQNSCNPVFIEVGLRLGVERYDHYFRKFGLLEKTGIDLPGEAGTIMHNPEKMGEVELATVAFGQSFQITPVQLAATVSSLINGGKRITPHLGVSIRSSDGVLLQKLEYPEGKQILSKETSQTMRYVLEQVVDGGSGKNAYIEGYRIGGKTATSETLPRSANQYISSFIGFAPAEDPRVVGLCVIHNPKGVYYGGTIAAPVIRDIFANILPGLGIKKSEVESNGETGLIP